MTRLDTALAAASGEFDGLVKLRRTSEPWRCRPDIPRSMARVKPDLRNCFRELVSGRRPWPLYLHGPVGCGKTRAALALLDVVDAARYWRLVHVMDAIMGHEAPWETLWGWPGGPQLAVLDEIGTSLRCGDLEYNAVMNFAEWREGKPSIYISNHLPTRIVGLYDERIQSRLTCGTIYHLQDRDRRHRRDRGAA